MKKNVVLISWFILLSFTSFCQDTIYKVSLNDTTVYSVLINDGTTLKLTAPFIDTSTTPDATLLFTTTFTKQ